MKTQSQTPFSEWLESLPHLEYRKKLKLIQEKTFVSRISVFNWRKGNHKVPPLAQQIINEIAGMDLLFPVVAELPTPKTKKRKASPSLS